MNTDRDNPRVVITGGGGMVGTALAGELRAHGYRDVVALTRADADLTDPAQAISAIAAARPSVVYHLAARVYGLGGNLRRQAELYADNVRINTNVVDAARRAGVAKVVAMGSAAVYSDAAPRPFREDAIWHGPPHGSEAGYAHAKRAMLAHLEACRDQYGMEYAFAVATNLFGPHDRFDEQTGHVIPSLLSKFERACRTGDPVTVWGTGTPQRDFVYVADAARALRLLGEAGHGPVNIATGAPVSIAAVVDAIAEATSYHGPIEWDRTKPDGQMLRDYDISRLQALGWAPSHTLAQGLRLTYDWLRANPDARR